MSYMHNDSSPDDVGGKTQATQESEFNLQAIHSSYKALKKSLSKTRKEHHLSHSVTLEQHKGELSPVARDK